MKVTSINIAPPQERYLCSSEEELFDLGFSLAKKVNAQTTLLLKGALGAGKTLFTRGLVDYFEVDSSYVSSPSFSIANEYEGSCGKILHLDLYRITTLEEWFSLGFDEHLGRMLMIIEWPELIQNEEMGKKLFVNIAILEDARREVTIEWQ